MITNTKYSTQQEVPNNILAGQMVSTLDCGNRTSNMGLTWTDTEWGTTSDTEIHSTCKTMNPHLIKF